jgi:large repetitive protein
LCGIDVNRRRHDPAFTTYNNAMNGELMAVFQPYRIARLRVSVARFFVALLFACLAPQVYGQNDPVAGGATWNSKCASCHAAGGRPLHAANSVAMLDAVYASGMPGPAIDATEKSNLVAFLGSRLSAALAITVPYNPGGGAASTFNVPDFSPGGAYTIYSSLGAVNANGATINFSNGPPVQVSYTAPVGQCSSTSFTYRGQGGTEPTSTRSASVTITNPSAPVATSNSPPAIAYSTSPTAIPLNLSGTAPTGITIVSQPSVGSVSVSGTTVSYSASNTAYSGTVTFTYRAIGPCGTQSAIATVTLTINPPPVPVITSAATASGTFGQAFTYNTIANNAPTSYALTGTLPPGVTFNTTTGVISGTPTNSGTFNVSITATNVTGASTPRAVTINIALPLPVITSGATINAGSGAAINYTITATNLATSFNATNLPAGLSVNTTTGDITGSVTVPSTQTFNATISATNATGTSNAPLTINISLAAPVVTSGATASGNVGSPFSYQITASDAPTSFAVSGALPAGVTLNTTTGLISGTPTAAGNFNITVTASNASGTSAPRAVAISIVLLPPAITSAATASGTAGSAFSYQIAASGSPTSFSATGLPPGVTVNTATGAISGTPTAAGTFTATVGATNASGTGTRVVTITISNFPVPTAGGISATTAFNTPVTINIGASIGGNFTGAALASQPANGTATINGLVVTYTPNPGFFGTDTFTYTATGPGGTTSPATISVAVATPPAPTAASLTLTTAANTVGTVDLSKGATGVFTSVALATQPTNGTATLSGNIVSYTPNRNFFGTDSFTYTVTGPGGTTAPATVTITVNALPPLAGPLNFILPLNTPTTLDLAPFITGSAISGINVVTNPAHGTVTVNGTRVTFTPAKDYFGADSFTYTAFGIAGASPAATVRVTITGRPDPTKQAAVTGLVAAQIDSADRFAKTQIGNFQSRLESLHRVEESASAPASAPAKKAEGASAPTRAASERGDTNSKTSFLHDSFAAATPRGQALAEPFPFSAEIVSILSSRSLNVAKASDGGGGGGTSSNSGAPSFWIAGTANFGTRDASGNRGELDFTTNGISLGADKRFTRELVAGVGAGLGRDRTDIGTDGSRSKARGYSLVGYGSYQPGAGFYVDSLIGIGSLDFKSRRYVEAINAYANGDRGGRLLFGSVAAGLEMRNNGVLFAPYGRIDFSSSRLNNASESSGGQYALNFTQQTVNSLQGVVGARAESLQPTSFGAMTPRLRLEYRREFRNPGESGVGYADLGGGPQFTFKVPAAARNQLAFGIGSDFIYRNGIKIGLDYEVLHSFNRDNNQSVRLNFTTPLDGRGAPFALSALSLMPQRPQDIQLETGYVFDDNITRSKFADEKLIDRSFNMSVGKGYIFKFDEVDNAFFKKTRAVVTASVGGEKFQNYDGLSRATSSLQGEFLYRPSAEFSAPTFALTAIGTGEYFRSDLRRGYRASLGASVRGPITDRINYLVGVAHNQRFARSSVFSGREHSVRSSLDYALSPTEVVYLNGEYRRGHFISSGRGSLDSLAIADVFIVDDAFPTGFITYRTRGDTFLSTLGYNLGFGERHSLDLSWRRVQSTPEISTSLLRTPKSYIVDQYSIVYLIRF